MKKNSVVIIFSILCIILWFIPTGFESSQSKDSYLSKARVITSDNSDISQYLIVKTGVQGLTAEVLDGPHKGEIVDVNNTLSGKMEFDEAYDPGDFLLIEYQLRDGQINNAYARGHYRLNHELVLIAAFCIFISIVAGFTGVKAILSFIFAAFMLWKILIPLFLKDISPVPVALAVVALLTASVSFLIGGFTRKGITAFAGSFSGLILACILSHIFAGGFHLHGVVRPFAESLLYAGYPHLDLTGIFLSGIFLSCSGAVMDLSMDIAASIDEIKNKKPDIKAWELFFSGMNVGRSVIGTMTTTLLLAYSGSYTFMLMNFMGMGFKVKQILNMNFIASEILNVFVGSFGLVAVGPFTALIGALIFSIKMQKNNKRNRVNGYQ